MKQKIVIDCDNTFGVPGRPIDDGQAILYVLGNPDFELLGITTTYGNGPIEDVYEATKWLVGRSISPDIPVFKGNSRIGEPSTEASEFLVRTVARYPGEVSLVAIGSMGNIHRAAQDDTAFYTNLRSIVCMGGYRHRLPVQGWSSIPELNLSRDPEASYGMLNAPCPVTIFDAHVCLEAPFGLRELHRWYEFDKRAYYIQLDYLLANLDELSEPTDYLWDLLPVVYLVRPELFRENHVRLLSTVEELGKGVLRSKSIEPGKEHTLNAPDLITDIDEFYRELFSSWKRSPLQF